MWPSGSTGQQIALTWKVGHTEGEAGPHYGSMLDYLTTSSRRALRRGRRAFTREVDVGEARIFVDHGFQWDGANNVWLTRARASFVLGVGPSFDIRPRGFLSRVLGIELGSPSGDPCFDDFFVVRSNDVAGTFEALTTRVRSLLATSFDDARLVSDGNMVVLWREGDFGRESDAALAVELVSEIAQYQSAAMAAVRTVPGSLYVPASGAWDARRPPAVYTRTPTPVRLAPMNCDGRPVMSASAACGRSARSFELAIDGRGRIDGPLDRFPPGVGSTVDEVGPCAIECDTAQVTLMWPGLETDRQRLTAGAWLISALSRTHSSGLYR